MGGGAPLLKLKVHDVVPDRVLDDEAVRDAVAPARDYLAALLSSRVEDDSEGGPA